jgi:HSP20 family protein
MSPLHRDLWNDVLSIEERMDRLFDLAFGRGESRASGVTGVIPVDVLETPEEYVVEASLPGFRPEDVEVTLGDGVLVIRATPSHRARAVEGRYLLRERSLGALEREILLPDEVDADRVTARVADGVLTVTVPRVRQTTGRRIPVRLADAVPEVVDTTATPTPEDRTSGPGEASATQGLAVTSGVPEGAEPGAAGPAEGSPAAEGSEVTPGARSSAGRRAGGGGGGRRSGRPDARR